MLRTAFVSILCGSIFIIAGCQSGIGLPGDGGGSGTSAKYVSADVSGRNPSGGGTGGMGVLDSAAPTTATNTESTSQVTREIEEADIVKLIDHNLFVLNSFRGLRIIDVTDWSKPVLKGGFAFTGMPIDMYVTNNVAAIIVRNGFTCRLDAQAQPVKQAGSTIYMVNVSDLNNPVAIDAFDIDGYVGESRRVGDVIYLAGTLAPPAVASTDTPVPQGGSGGGSTSGATSVSPMGPTSISSPVPSQVSATGFVTSVLVTDPQNVKLVDQKQFAGKGDIIHATTSAIYVAGFDWTNGMTNIQYVDISDPAGAIALRGTASVRGCILDRFAIDANAGVLRVVVQRNPWMPPQPVGTGSQPIDNTAGVKLFTFSVANPDNITSLGSLVVIQDESVKAVRFDGLKAYVVTFRQTDPLWVLDLADPAAPAISGYLQAPGYSTYLQSDGNRLVAVGVNDARGSQAQVSLYDVADPAHPKELDRVILNPTGYSTSPANFDEKAFKLIPDAKLILVPFDAWAASGYKNELAMLDYSGDNLTELATVDSRGTALRSDVDLAANVLWIVSNKALQTLNIADRTAPVKLAELPIADTVLAWKVFGQYGLRLVAANDSYDSPAFELQVLAADDPNANTVLARQTFNLYNPRLLVPSAGLAALTGVDANDNMTLVTINTNALPALTVYAQTTLPIFPDGGWGGIYLMQSMGMAAPRQTMGMPGMAIMPRVPCWGSMQDNPMVLANGGLAYITMSVTGTWQDWMMQKQVKLVSLADPASPQIAGTVNVNSDNFDAALRVGASGNTVFATLERFMAGARTASSGPAQAAYYVRLIDCTDLANPTAQNAINVPGIAVGLKDGYVFSVDPQWTGSAIGTRFCSSRIDNGVATLSGSVDLPAGAPGNVMFAGNAAVMAVENFSYLSYGYGYAGGGGISYAEGNVGTAVASPAMPVAMMKTDDCSLGSFNLVSINITDPANPVLATNAQYPGSGGLAGIADSYVVGQANYGGQALIWKLAGDQTLSFNQVVNVPSSITDITPTGGLIDLACGPGGVIVVTPNP